MKLNMLGYVPESGGEQNGILPSEIGSVPKIMFAEMCKSNFSTHWLRPHKQRADANKIANDFDFILQ